MTSRVGNRIRDFFGVLWRQFSRWWYLRSRNKLFVHTIWSCTSQNVNFFLFSEAKLDLFAQSLTHVVGACRYSDFHFCEISRVNECYASKLLQSGEAFIRVSEFQVNLGWRNRQRKCFSTTDIFRCNWNHHQLQRCVELQQRNVKFTERLRKWWDSAEYSQLTSTTTMPEPQFRELCPSCTYTSSPDNYGVVFNLGPFWKLPERSLHYKTSKCNPKLC